MQAFELYKSALRKAGGAGSRGGHVVGHTRSGKPIYATGNARSKKYVGFSREDHDDAAQAHLKQSNEHAALGQAAIRAKNQAMAAGDHVKESAAMSTALSHAKIADKHAGQARSHARWDFD